MSKKEKLIESELTFRKVKLREQLSFYKYAMKAVDEFATSSLGFSWKALEKLLKINRLTFGLLGKIFMKNMTDIVALYNDEIVAGYTLIREKEKYELGNLFTRPEYQGRGIAKIVMTKIIAENNDNPIELMVDKENEIAINIYKKFDFKEVSSTKQYIIKTPLRTNSFPTGYSARLAVKSDFKQVDKLRSEIPKIDAIIKAYRKGINKTQKKALRFEYQLPVVLLKDDEIVGLARAMWSKTTPDTAQILASAILAEAKEAYPSLISYISEELCKFDIVKFVWDVTERTRPFEEFIKPFIGSPAREGIIMKRNN